MKLKKYDIITTIMALIVSPIVVTIGLMGAMYLNLMTDFVGVYALTPVLLILMWALYAKKAALPQKASRIFLPVLGSFSYYLCIWIVIFGLSGYRYDNDFFVGYVWLALPYFVIHLLLSLMGGYYVFPLVSTAVSLVTLFTIVTTCAICKRKIVYDKRMLAYGCVILCLCGIAGFQFYDRSKKILAEDYEAGRIHEEVNLYEYHPFGTESLNNLRQLGEPASISIAGNYPKLDGATAAYPVYAAMVQEIYQGLDESTVGDYVSCTTTATAYERLINGEIDIFFGAQPAQQQVEKAKRKGVEFTLTPIAKEAFVFFVNSENPVDSLTLEEIQDIYRKKITNWRDVGGNNETIMPFQRPEYSGSQTIMLAVVMKDKSLPTPLLEEYSGGMGDIISQVAQYRNYSSAIGYSFRFFATGMKPNDNIKLLAIDGIEPTVENIANGTYPFTVDVYAVTARTTNKNAHKLIQWILSQQGQEFIELCGYVRR